MTRKQQRLTMILSGLGLLALAGGLALFALRDTIVFFYTPSEVISKNIASGIRIRLGGMVEAGTLVKNADGTVRFKVTDQTKSLQTTYKGLLPDLFREGQGVVAEGYMNAAGVFAADTVLAKHDEKYMPRELVDKLKEQGKWKASEPSQ